MADLEITFQCMCLFVPEPLGSDPARGTVHVLMPKTSCCHGAGAGVPEHVVKLIHPRFAETRGVPLAGWMLELGDESGSAEVSLEPGSSPGNGTNPEIVNLTEFTDLNVPRELLFHGVGDVIARVVLRGGYLKEIAAEAAWSMGDRTVEMASRITWRIDGVRDEHVKWTGPGTQAGGPVDILELPPVSGGDGVIRFGIHHQPEEVLDTPDDPRLDPTMVRDHFRVFYDLLGVESPDEFPLPEIETPPPGDLVHCGAARASLA